VHAARHRNDIELEEWLMKRLAKRIASLGLAVLLLGMLPTFTAFGDEVAAAGAVAVATPPPPAIDTGDTSWLLISTALVLMMTIPGLSLFYGGLVRRKNVLSVLMQCFMITCLISVQWILWGYSLSFGPDIKGFIGSLDWFGLKGVGLDPNPDYAATVPHQAFMIFQMMFAVITPARSA
jgi:Amt family ammonium transporter